MNDLSGTPALDERAAVSSFIFTGTWREFLPIALTNFALTVVTLGIYRFWAKARERRYLWSRTHFIDDAFEWTGTGKEMFFGFLVVAAVLVPAFLFIQFGFQALVLRGEGGLAALAMVVLYVGFFYLYHVAKFRALRYRLSRTYWHGIRGGSDEGGFAYGGTGLWKMLAGSLAFGFLIPWALTQLWNRRWSAMSFGPHPIEAHADSDGLMSRWMFVYLAPLLALLFGVVAGGLIDNAAGDEGTGGAIASFIASALILYGGILLASVAFYALFYRTVAAATSVAGIEFGFTAGTRDWLKLYLGHIGLVIATLGVGLLFISYRNWAFIIRHMEASGIVDLETLIQSTARAPGDAEGLADAFDFGAV